ncbi:MAG TPA: helix-turn-helix transcriptional regulator [Pseudobdellovibrionaceae bacterium]
MDIDKIVISKIFKLMDEKNISQRQLAKDAKINYQNLNRLIKGHRSIVKSDILPDLAKALGVTTEFLKSVNMSDKTDLFATEKPQESKTELLGQIMVNLNALNEDQLRSVLGFTETALRPSSGVLDNLANPVKLTK